MKNLASLYSVVHTAVTLGGLFIRNQRLVLVMMLLFIFSLHLTCLLPGYIHYWYWHKALPVSIPENIWNIWSSLDIVWSLFMFLWDFIPLLMVAFGKSSKNSIIKGLAMRLADNARLKWLAIFYLTNLAVFLTMHVMTSVFPLVYLTDRVYMTMDITANIPYAVHGVIQCLLIDFLIKEIKPKVDETDTKSSVILDVPHNSAFQTAEEKKQLPDDFSLYFAGQSQFSYQTKSVVTDDSFIFGALSDVTVSKRSLAKQADWETESDMDASTFHSSSFRLP